MDLRVSRPPEITWDGGRQPTWLACSTCRSGSQTYTIGGQSVIAAKWWSALMERARDMLKQRPCGETVLQPSLLDPVFQAALACGTCRLYSFLNEFKSFLYYFAKVIDEKVAEVSYHHKLSSTPSDKKKIG